MPSGIPKNGINKGQFTSERARLFGFQKGHKTNLGRKFGSMSDGTREKMSISGKGKHYYWLGKKRPDMVGKNNPAKKPEIRKKISDALHGKRCWKIHPMVGKKFSEESKKKMSEAQRGEKSHMWRGGISFEPYSVDWTNTLKKSIRERDHYICQLCFGEGYPVHHVDYNKKNCNPDNLITLCNKCNSRVNFNRNYWINYFHEIMSSL